MTRLDRHLAMQFLKVSLFAIIAFSVIFIMVDMIENLDDFIDENVPTHMIAAYYVYFLPRILSLMVPVALLLSGLFVVGKMSATNELTIIKCSGVSLSRYMRPFLALALLVSLGMLGFDGYLVPRINAARLSIEREYLKKNLRVGGRYNMYFQDTDNRIVSVEYFDESVLTARRVSIQQFRTTDPTVMQKRIDAASMRWDLPRRRWKLQNATSRTFLHDSSLKAARRETVERDDSLDAPVLALTPEVIARMQQKPEEMELDELRDYIDRQRRAGSDIDRLLVDYHGKIAFPFASLIVVFFAVPFASVKRRSGLSVQFGISIFLCFVYLVGQKLSQIFGYNGSIPAILAAWLPNMLFLVAAGIVITRVQK
ncbi:MAG: LPS export ABC transporter permease LptG [Ignavibacteriae bacterium]|nr:LPS export ABC transporter permease LptG [Ignavibacteriota bacterium]